MWKVLLAMDPRTFSAKVLSYLEEATQHVQPCPKPSSGVDTARAQGHTYSHTPHRNNNQNSCRLLNPDWVPGTGGGTLRCPTWSSQERCEVGTVAVAISEHRN